MSWSDGMGSLKILREDSGSDSKVNNDAASLAIPRQISPLKIPSSIPQDVVGRGSKKRAHQCIGRDEADEDDGADELGADKKRRLTAEQVKFLEMSFTMDLKLEPERKALIAKQLGIRPRQVAIWFQNRRARWKNKQLEHEYDTLKAKYEAEMKEKENRMKEHEAAMEENKKLQAEVANLKGQLQGLKKKGSASGMEMVEMVEPRVDEEDNDDDDDDDDEEEDRLGKEEEESSGKSEVASPAKSSDGQSEMQDSGQSSAVMAVMASREPPAYYYYYPAMDEDDAGAGDGYGAAENCGYGAEAFPPDYHHHHHHHHHHHPLLLPSSSSSTTTTTTTTTTTSSSSTSSSTMDDAFGSLVQQLFANGIDPDEAYRIFFSSFDEDHFHGLPWGSC